MAKTFPYDRIESLYPVVNKLIAAIRDLPQRDWSPDVRKAIIAVNAMGEEEGFGWLTTPEERAVASAMKQVFCGPRTAHYGWRLYARYRQGGQLCPINISY